MEAFAQNLRSMAPLGNGPMMRAAANVIESQYASIGRLLHTLAEIRLEEKAPSWPSYDSYVKSLQKHIETLQDKLSVVRQLNEERADAVAILTAELARCDKIINAARAALGIVPTFGKEEL